MALYLIQDAATGRPCAMVSEYGKREAGRRQALARDHRAAGQRVVVHQVAMLARGSLGTLEAQVAR